MICALPYVWAAKYKGNDKTQPHIRLSYLNQSHCRGDKEPPFLLHDCLDVCGTVPTQAIRMLTIEQTERWEIMQASAAVQQVQANEKGLG